MYESLSKHKYSEWFYFISSVKATVFIKSFMYILGLSTLLLYHPTCICHYICSGKCYNSSPIPKLFTVQDILGKTPPEPLPAERTPVLHLVKSLEEDIGEQPFPRGWGRRLGRENVLCTA